MRKSTAEKWKRYIGRVINNYEVIGHIYKKGRHYLKLKCDCGRVVTRTADRVVKYVGYRCCKATKPKPLTFRYCRSVYNHYLSQGGEEIDCLKNGFSTEEEYRDYKAFHFVYAHRWHTLKDIAERGNASHESVTRAKQKTNKLRTCKAYD